MADCLKFLKRFPERLEPLCVQPLWYKSGGRFFRNKQPWTYYTYNDKLFQSEFFPKWIFKLKQGVKSTLRSKNYCRFTICQYLSIACLRLVPKSSKTLPKYGKSQLPLRNNETKVFFDNQFIRKLFNTLIHQILGIIIVWISTLKFHFPDESSHDWSII